MPLPTFNPPVGPSPGTAYKPTVNLWEAEFGDGYSQPTPKGLNHIRNQVELKWSALTLAQMQQIRDFFIERGGNKAFYYKSWGETAPIKWTCKEWAPADDNGVWTFSATLIQDFSNQA